jgi:probable rRNA maturation factor
MSSDGSLLIFRSVPVHLKLGTAQKRDLRNFAGELSGRIAPGRPFSCLITNDEELRRLNREFLNHDYPTDVLSFPAAARSRELGDLAISIERADAQAREYEHALLDELRVLMLHGVLHLSGMDHERDGGEMARAERKFRKEFDLPGGLIARARK